MLTLKLHLRQIKTKFMMQTSQNVSLRRPSRRKSCGECFKSKRRCDQNLPACSRCVKLKMTCCYAAPPAAQCTNSQMNAPINESTMNEATPSGIVSPPSLLNDDELPQMDEVDLGFLFLNESIDLDLTSQATPPQWLQSAASDPLRSDLFSRAASQLNYAIDILKTAPSQMVLENSTPWSHPLLYKDHMPKSINDAHAACALYMARNDVNKHMIFRAIESRAKELLAAPQIMTPTEILARVQSLILYQIIRLYDGDIRLRAQGEASMEEFELQTFLLLRLLDEHNMSNIPTPTQDPFTTTNYLNSLSSPPIPHTLWIFQESCRRTFLFSFFMFSFYNMLKNGTCHKDAFPEIRPWTFSSHLWKATSEFDFKVAWNEKKHFVVQNLDFDEVLSEAQLDDIDDFGRLFLVLARGLDYIREWFYNRGGTLIYSV